ncbi:MAG: hypothetical protein HC945_03345 [Nitrosarchaeum sp.]|nr:hypothetical protein [Nitrosarchaeum sp.]
MLRAIRTASIPQVLQTESLTATSNPPSRAQIVATQVLASDTHQQEDLDTAFMHRILTIERYLTLIQTLAERLKMEAASRPTSKNSLIKTLRDSKG